MEDAYLLIYISRRLHTIVRKYSLNGELVSTVCERVGFDDCKMVEDASALFVGISGKAPVLLSVNGEFLYAMVENAQSRYVIGPVCCDIPKNFAHQVSVPAPESSWKSTVACCRLIDLAEELLLLHNQFHEPYLDVNDLFFLNCVHPDIEEWVQEKYLENVFENRENERPHNPYDQEVRECQAIENGDTDKLKKSIQEIYPGEVGTLARTSLRQAKNNAIVVITLASRAAIRGGLSSEISYSISDARIQMIEECQDVPTIVHLFRAAEFQYAQMVQECNSNKKDSRLKGWNAHVEECKNYIFLHLHEKISIQKIADVLGLNPNYLSELFYKYENSSIKKFILREKINLVKNMLMYSTYSCTEIASYLGFSSQSHMGACFKKETGMTPREYRKKFGKVGNRIGDNIDSDGWHSR